MQPPSNATRRTTSPKMARFVLVLLFAGVVMGVAPAQLATWLEKSVGLKGQKLTSAVSICEAEEIETVAELRKIHDDAVTVAASLLCTLTLTN
eukprot:SAG22_NODE_835_length_6917_cov_8.098709_8_plen_93_part_00